MGREGAANKPKPIQRKEVADYSFAFNDCNFSGRTLQIVISMDPQEIRYDGSIRLQEDDNNAALQNSPENAGEVGQESSSDDTLTDDDNGEKKIRIVQVNSAILAESSKIFKKLFSSGMREIKQIQASIHISPSEEQAFIYLLKCMYGGAIETQSTKELLDVLMLAEKFEVPCCIHGCVNALDSLPMTIEFASLVLCLPSRLLTIDAMRPIVIAAEGFLLSHFSNTNFVEEYINLPVHIIEQLMKSDELDIPSEDDIYEFAIKWVERHYQDEDERREMFQNKLMKLIRLPQMTDYKLAEILLNKDMHNASAMKLVWEALSFKVGVSSESRNLEDKRFSERSYNGRPIRAIELLTPEREYRVFCDFNIDRSQSSHFFYMWGRQFKLSFSSTIFGFVFLYIDSGIELKHPVEYVVFFRSNLSKDFCEVSRGKVTSAASVYGKNLIFDSLKTDLVKYSFDNVIHLQAVFT